MNIDRPDTETILTDLYNSEINASIEWMWDKGVDVSLGDDLNGWKESATLPTFAAAAAWLRDAAIRNFPDSEFARRRVLLTSFTVAARWCGRGTRRRPPRFTRMRSPRWR